MYSRLGSRFKELREAAGFTQSSVAKYLGVDQSYISKFEKDERQFSIDLLSKAVILFGCSLDELMTGKAEPSPFPIAMRACDMNEEDLETIATMNKLALNLRYMEGLMKGWRV